GDGFRQDHPPHRRPVQRRLTGLAGAVASRGRPMAPRASADRPPSLPSRRTGRRQGFAGEGRAYRSSPGITLRTGSFQTVLRTAPPPVTLQKVKSLRILKFDTCGGNARTGAPDLS